MKSQNCLMLILVSMLGSTGCTQQKAADTRNPSGNSPMVQHNPRHSGTPTHSAHGHHHAFKDPSERAKKWNNPERDQWQRPEEIIASLKINHGDTVADIGAGTGYMVKHLSAEVGAAGMIIAIDTEPAMVRYLSERVPEMGPARVIPQETSPSDPELEANSIDAAMTLDTWHHMISRETYAKKVYDALKSGGAFAVVDYDIDADSGPPATMRVAPSQVVSELEAVGFRVEIMLESLPFHYIVVGHKR